MAIPTQEDGKMLIQLAQLGESSGLGNAMPVIFADDFDSEAADVMDAPVRTVLGYGELIGTLVKHDLISAELVRDYLWVEGVWRVSARQPSASARSSASPGCTRTSRRSPRGARPSEPPTRRLRDPPCRRRSPSAVGSAR